MEYSFGKLQNSGSVLNKYLNQRLCNSNISQQDEPIL
jgi:hypothetical protein